MKRIFALLFCLSVMSFAFAGPLSNCKKAVPDNTTGFCADFSDVADCHCVEKGLAKGYCKNNMSSLYQRMIDAYGSLEGACKQQTDVSVQECVDDWNCYIKGGKDSLGRVCNATGKKC